MELSHIVFRFPTLENVLWKTTFLSSIKPDCRDRKCNLVSQSLRNCLTAKTVLPLTFAVTFQKMRVGKVACLLPFGG